MNVSHFHSYNESYFLNFGFCQMHQFPRLIQSQNGILSQFLDIDFFPTIDYSQPRNRLYERIDGSIEIVSKTPIEVFGEYVMRPGIRKIFQLFENIDRIVSGFFNFIPVVRADHAFNKEKDSACRDPEEVLKEKLDNPDRELSSTESIALLSHCIYKGDIQTSKALGKRAVVLLGNTGSAKSTTVNYLLGLKMKKVKPQDIGLSGFGKVVIVDPDGENGEVTPIGHQITRSETFMPQVVLDEKNSIVYVDCPGFLDDRGSEINIANAVNIKKVIKNCETVKFVILINYHSLEANRANGIRQLIKICHHLFSSEESFLKHRGSVYVGITRAPRDFDIQDFEEAIAKEIPSLESFSSRFFSYDPLDEYGKRFWTREEFIEKLSQLIPIGKKESASLFKTVLRPEDENTLRRICESIDTSIIFHIKNKDLKRSLEQLKLLDSLKEIDHPLVYSLIERSNMHFVQAIQVFVRSFEMHCTKYEFDPAQEILDLLLGSEKFMTPKLKDALSIGGLKKALETAKQKKAEYDKKLDDLNDKIKVLENRPPQIIHKHYYNDDDDCIIL